MARPTQEPEEARLEPDIQITRDVRRTSILPRTTKTIQNVINLQNKQDLVNWTDEKFRSAIQVFERLIDDHIDL
jgi:translation elongation factor EF-1alpha